MPMKRENRRVAAACALRDAAAAIVYSQARLALALGLAAVTAPRPARAKALAHAAREAGAMVRAATSPDAASIELVKQAENLVSGITGPPGERDLQEALGEVRRLLVELWGVEL